MINRKYTEPGMIKKLDDNFSEGQTFTTGRTGVQAGQ